MCGDVPGSWFGCVGWRLSAWCPCGRLTLLSVVTRTVAAAMAHSPALHSPHIMRPKHEAAGAGFAPVAASSPPDSHAPSHVATPPRPVSTHTPGMPPSAASPMANNSGDHALLVQGNKFYHSPVNMASHLVLLIRHSLQNFGLTIALLLGSEQIWKKRYILSNYIMITPKIV